MNHKKKPLPKDVFFAFHWEWISVNGLWSKQHQLWVWSREHDEFIQAGSWDIDLEGQLVLTFASSRREMRFAEPQWLWHDQDRGYYEAAATHDTSTRAWHCVEIPGNHHQCQLKNVLVTLADEWLGLLHEVESDLGHPVMNAARGDVGLDKVAGMHGASTAASGPKHPCQGNRFSVFMAT